jgi:hypothetical protein
MILKKITVNKDFQFKLYPMDHHSCLNLDGLHLQHHFHITSNVENINELVKIASHNGDVIHTKVPEVLSKQNRKEREKQE